MFKHPLQNRTNVQIKGGGGSKAFWTMFKNTALFWKDGFPYFDFICAPSLEYHHHLYTLCNQRSVMRFFCAVIYSRSVAVQSKPCGTLAPVYGVNLAQGRTDPSKRLLLSSYFKGRKAKCQPEDRHLQKLAAPTNYVSKTETPSTHAH